MIASGLTIYMVVIVTNSHTVSKMELRRSRNQYPINPRFLKKALKKVQREQFLIGLLKRTRSWKPKTLTSTRVKTAKIHKPSTNFLSPGKNMVTMVSNATFSNDEDHLRPEFDNSSMILSEEECKLFEKYTTPTYLTDQLRKHDLLELKKLVLPPLKKVETQSPHNNMVDSFKQEKSSVTNGTEDDSSLEHQLGNTFKIINHPTSTSETVKLLTKEPQTDFFYQSLVGNKNADEKAKSAVSYEFDNDGKMSEKQFSDPIFKTISKSLGICKVSQAIRSFFYH
jgi:hypothetical protein